MSRILFSFCLLTLLIAGGARANEEKLAFPYNGRICVPVADLRAEPADPPAKRGHDPLEETQLLYGDPVRVLQERGEWLRVLCPEQQEFTHHQAWEGYPGWIRKTAVVVDQNNWFPKIRVGAKQAIARLKPFEKEPPFMTFSIGTRLVGKKEKNWWKIRLLDGTQAWIPDSAVSIPSTMAETARLFLGDPYYWGGRSAYDPQQPVPPHTGVDCSGLTGLVYQAHGSLLPRDAHEQWMNCAKISREQLKPDDLVFLFDLKNSEKVTHVMLYIGNNEVIEAPGTGKTVRAIDLDQRLREEPDRKTAYGTYPH
jgi:hypothetical protein